MSRNFEILQRAKKSQAIFGGAVDTRVGSDTSLLEVEEQPGSDRQLASRTLPLEIPLPVKLVSDKRTHSYPEPDENLPGQQAKRSPLRTFALRWVQQKKLFRLETLIGLGVFRRPNEGALKNKFPVRADLIREEEIKLVQRVFLAEKRQAPQVVLFCGVEGGNGCTSVCAGAGKALAAHVPGAVCLVDANLRSPALHQHFGLENHRGFADTVSQSDDLAGYLQAIPGSNLSILTCGQLPPQPYSLLGADSLRSRMKELRSRFDYVLIDSPPVGLCNDATLLGQMADGIVLVVEANSTRPEIAQKAKQTFEAANLRVLGAVLTKRTFPIPESIYRKLW